MKRSLKMETCRSEPKNNMVFRYSKSLNKGTRRYMEDIAQTCKSNDPAKGTFFAIFDGHGGKNAARFAEKHLWKTLLCSEDFQSGDPEKVKGAIKEAFLKTHSDMWHVIDNWPKRKNGMNSTSGTTATVAILRGRRLYVAQLGDSGLVLAKRNKENGAVEAHYVTAEHKPDAPEEKSRINSHGGCVATVNGVPRVVWKRPIQNGRANATTRRSAKFEYIPFLAVSRALGDLWSFDKEKGVYLVSPEPEVECFEIKEGEDWFMILASDGLWGVVDAQEAVNIVATHEERVPENINSAANLIHMALNKWSGKKVKADNISAITVFFDEEPRPGEIISEEDDDSSGFTTVLEEEGEETPPDVPIKAGVPQLKRSKSFRVSSLEEFARLCSQESTSYIEAAVIVHTTARTDSELLPSQSCGLANVKRKLPSSITGPVNCSKRRRASSEGSPTNQTLLTEVSPKSLQSLKLDKDLSEISQVTRDFV